VRRTNKKVPKDDRGTCIGEKGSFWETHEAGKGEGRQKGGGPREGTQRFRQRGGGWGRRPCEMPRGRGGGLGPQSVPSPEGAPTKKGEKQKKTRRTNKFTLEGDETGDDWNKQAEA